jgi:hypothetical protein
MSLDSDSLHDALEASCDALMVLQSIEPEDTGHGAAGPAATRHLHHAIDSLRSAIAQLRMARDENASLVGLGFVLRDDCRHMPGAPTHRQVRPRRTA